MKNRYMQITTECFRLFVGEYTHLYKVGDTVALTPDYIMLSTKQRIWRIAAFYTSSKGIEFKDASSTREEHDADMFEHVIVLLTNDENKNIRTVHLDYVMNPADYPVKFSTVDTNKRDHSQLVDEWKTLRDIKYGLIKTRFKQLSTDSFYCTRRDKSFNVNDRIELRDGFSIKNNESYGRSYIIKAFKTSDEPYTGEIDPKNNGQKFVDVYVTLVKYETKYGWTISIPNIHLDDIMPHDRAFGRVAWR